MTMNHLSFSFSGFALCARCVRWSVLFLESYLSLFVCSFRAFARSLIRCGLLGFVGVYGCHSEWVNSIFAFGSNIRTFAKSFVHSFLACVLSVHGNVIYISYTFCLCSSWLGSLVGWLESLEMYKIEPTIHTQLAYQAAMHVVWSERLETRNSEFLSSVFTRFIFAALALWLERFLLVKLFSAPPPHVHMCVCCVFVSCGCLNVFSQRIESEFRIREIAANVDKIQRTHSNSNSKILFEPEKKSTKTVWKLRAHMKDVPRKERRRKRTEFTEQSNSNAA